MDGDGCLSVPAIWSEQEEASTSSYQLVPYKNDDNEDISEDYYELQQEQQTHVEDVLSQHRYNYKITTMERQTGQYNDMYKKVSESPVSYHCKICGKTVTNRWHHTAIHKPQFNQCPMCRQTFTRKDNMKAHAKVKHGYILTD